ncbi:MAG: septum formation family protein [Pseudonocardia sp.]|nr:septum formation family protein [Pseudonocardia sp.]
MMTADMDRLRTAPDRTSSAPRRAAVMPPPAPGPRPRSTPGPTTDGAGRSAGRVVARVGAGVLVGALTMFGVATLDTFVGATVPLLGTFAALPAPEPEGSKTVEIPPPPATPGTCLNWTRADAADAAVVSCAQPHLFEQAGTVALADQTLQPDDRQFRLLVNERCSPVVLTYLDGRYDPDGRYRVGALKPSPAKWDQGDRELRCGLQSASRSGALYPNTGRAADSDQSAVQEAGVCLAIDGPTFGDPVDCAGPHAVEAVGIVDLTEKFPDAYPVVGDQDAFLQPECARIADEYAGGSEVIAEKKLTVYWDNLTEESWDAGSRRVNCNLGALLPDRLGFAPVTGSVRGEVVVGQAPAPPATNTPEPGVPAPTTTKPAAPTGGLPGAPLVPGAPPRPGAPLEPGGEILPGEQPPPGGDAPPPGTPPQQELPRLPLPTTDLDQVLSPSRG